MSLRYLTMPKWGIEMQQGTLTEWHVQEGETITKGQLIALIETDKITNELEADTPGVLHKVLVPEGEVKTVGELLAILGDEGDNPEAIEAFLAAFQAADTSMAAGATAPAAQAESASEPVPAESDAPIGSISEADFANIKISPAAKRRAITLGLAPDLIVSTSKRGRISMQDVEQSAIANGLLTLDSSEASDASTANKTYSNEPTITPMSAMRKTVAKRLTEAKSTIPHFYLRSDIRVDTLLEAKSAYQAKNGKVSVNDLLIKAAALALIENPDVNVQLHGDDIHSFKHADIAVAVSTPRGLITPVVRSADLRGIRDISSAMKDMAERARDNKLTHEDIAAGTFTLSNLGMFGIDQFDAIINPPQCAILAVGTKRTVWTQEGEGGVFANYISCSLSCDHRAIDGALGAAFLKSLKTLIESPQRLFD
ncbi:MAG: dihydrolipoamide acetyltransferase family protein [Maricaulaceae bacterium]